MTTATASLTATLTDGNAREVHTDLGELITSIERWYEYLPLSAAEAPDFITCLTEEELSANAITAIVLLRLTADIMAWEQKIAAALGYSGCSGHGNYVVLPSDQAGLRLRIASEPAPVTYAVVTDGGDESIVAADWEAAKAALHDIIDDDILADGGWGYVINPDDDTRYYVGRENMS